MAKVMRLGGLGTLVVAIVGVFALSGGPAMGAPLSTPRAYACTGGAIPSGSYASVTVTGACSVATNAVISVAGNVNVAPNAVLDAQSAPSTITVRGNVNAFSGSLLGLGCLPNPPEHQTGHPCTVDPTESSSIIINGNVTAIGANTVLLNGITVRGNVTLIGGGDQAGNPWPIKNNTIGGNLTVTGATPEWVGVLLNKVGGNVILTNINIAPGETIQVTLNTIRANLICSGLAPAVSGGVIPGEVNVVGGHALGQCANLT
jgi:hypothetical protein